MVNILIRKIHIHIIFVSSGFDVFFSRSPLKKIAAKKKIANEIDPTRLLLYFSYHFHLSSVTNQHKAKDVPGRVRTGDLALGSACANHYTTETEVAIL